MSLPTNFFMAKGGGEAPLYNFTSQNFYENTRGMNGPSFTTIQNRYTGQPFMDGGFLIQGAFQGYHRLTLPSTGSYRFTAAGASGNSTGNYHGGRGAIVRGDMSFAQGDEIQFIIGQSGGTPHNYNAGGGGGTFVVKQAFFNSGGQTNSNIVIVAGGGAGGGYDVNGYDANFSTNGVDGDNNSGSGGTNGNGSYDGGGAGAGGAGGIFSGPINYTPNGTRSIAYSFTNGAVGGKGFYNNTQSGFGGSGGSGNHAGGTGGGYSGGGGGTGNGQRSGGGGSYKANLSNSTNVGYNGSNPVTSQNGTNGYLTIEFLG